MKDRSIEELVRSALAGDESAHEQLVRRHLRAAFAVALSVVGNTSDAEDIAQEAFLVAFERLETCREPARFSGWLLQIVRNRAKNAVERRRVRHSFAARTSGAARDELLRAEPPAADAAVRSRLLTGLEKLTQLQREVMLLHDLDDWTHREIAEALQISEVSSRQHLFNGRRIMRGLLEEAVTEDQND